MDFFEIIDYQDGKLLKKSYSAGLYSPKIKGPQNLHTLVCKILRAPKYFRTAVSSREKWRILQDCAVGIDADGDVAVATLQLEGKPRAGLRLNHFDIIHMVLGELRTGNRGLHRLGQFPVTVIALRKHLVFRAVEINFLLAAVVPDFNFQIAVVIIALKDTGSGIS